MVQKLRPQNWPHNDFVEKWIIMDRSDLPNWEWLRYSQISQQEVNKNGKNHMAIVYFLLGVY